MYKILLIDDDRAFLESFYKLVKWEKYGFEVVARLGDGGEALEYIENNAIDAIVTDIKMPQVSGVELASIVYNNYSDIKIVFFSAFCGFEYVTQAIKYNVVGYIGKPISLEQLEETLERLHSVLSDRDIGVVETIAPETIAKREDIFCRWLDLERVENDLFKKELEEVNISYQSVHLNCAFAVFDIIGIETNFEDEWKDDKRNFYDAIKKTICVDTGNYYTILLDFSENTLIVLYLSKNSGAISEDCTKTAIDDLKTVFNLTLIASSFSTFDSLSELKEMTKVKATSELRYLKKALEAHKTKEIFTKAEKYVYEHYSEDINLEDVAKECHFNSQYFSKIFKETTGDKFIDYLNKVRIEKAKELLKSEDSVEKIAGKVGFKSRRHFYTVFSQYTGDTPASYRKKIMERW